jgi:putative nucleotidyltransferase with HDIG domain
MESDRLSLSGLMGHNPGGVDILPLIGQNGWCEECERTKGMSDTRAYEKYLNNLPVIPEVATRIMGMAEDAQDVSFGELEDIVSVDPGLTAKILKVANSAMYARQREITSLRMAISLLGFKNIKSLVMLVAASSMFARKKGSRFYPEYWRHSINTAFLARSLAGRTGRKDVENEAFLGGLLHDIGKAAFYNASGEEYEQILQQVASEGLVLEDVERTKLGVDHKNLGATVLAKWFFPDVYVDTAREHASRNITSRHKGLILIVSIADLVAQRMGHGLSRPDRDALFSALLPHLGQTEEQIHRFEEKFPEEVREDSLYQQCYDLFGISS